MQIYALLNGEFWFEMFQNVTRPRGTHVFWVNFDTIQKIEIVVPNKEFVMACKRAINDQFIATS